METLTQTPPSPTAQRVIHTAQLITAMLKSNGHVSDLIFSPGRAPQIEVSGQLVELKYKGLECLSAADTKSIAYDIMGDAKSVLKASFAEYTASDGTTLDSAVNPTQSAKSVLSLFAPGAPLSTLTGIQANNG